jgi:Putative DNA-binding domain
MALDESDLLRLLHLTEHSFVERKTSGDSKDWIKTVVAFANTLDPSQEGVLFIGARDDGEIEEKSSGFDKVQKTFSDKVQSIYPSVYYTTKIVKEGDWECLAIIVPGSPSKPHFAGPLYLRDGSQSIIAKAEQFESLLAARISKAQELQRWLAKDITMVEYKRGAGVGYVVHKYPTQAKIEGCNQFYVTVSMGNRKKSYPLVKVEIAYDHQSNQLQLEHMIIETES